MEITAKVTGAAEMTKRFQDAGKAVKPAMGKAVRRATKIVQNTARGKVPRRTGKLARSIYRRTKTVGNLIVGRVGTKSPYGPITEFGFSGTEQVREYLRKTISGDTTVRAHLRKLTYPKHPFLWASVAENQGAVMAELNQGMSDALAGINAGEEGDGE